MDFDKLSEKYKTIKSPGASQNLKHPELSEPNSLLETIKKEYAVSKKQSKRFYIISAITAVVYFLMFIINPDPELSLLNRIAGSCYVAASLILFTLFWKKHKKIKSSSYLASPKMFLQAAKTRFQFWTPTQLWLIVIVVLVDIGSSFSILKYLGETNKITGILIFQLVYFSLLIFGYYKGKKEWQRNKKPIVRKIEKMLAGFDEQ